jgi:hypothetical protein
LTLVCFTLNQNTMIGNLFLFLGALGGLELILFVFIPVVLWIWALVDCLKSDFSGSNKLIWLLLIILLPVLGSILYFLIGRGQRI